MRLSIDAYLDYTLDAPADLLFALEVAQMHDQILVADRLVVGGVEPLRPVLGEESLGRRTWAEGEGRVTAHYTATVDIDRVPTILAGLSRICRRWWCPTSSPAAIARRTGSKRRSAASLDMSRGATRSPP